ncbi:histidine phosphatase family protein [Priestia taiwanensis]|uniref:Phosphoglycerate mutase n=1 Tax=Priestia taiwanensis TaxID=1347902 RepID=A0A917AND6_9BACI|nr:histidine phosphatase family protein [Priestia taiwanensis]MBM7362381.1 2,3-bisphosphoglycerate-dependent phosphoglycerate mutase [Priestia taiwanensis]GGE61721.1 phosphoglycerate mutase [Priestia taiwanensis]
MKRFILIRHCQATGQEIEAPLTNKGERQALLLKDYLLASEYHIDKIVSSHYKRAIESIEPFAKHIDTLIHIDERLGERVLSDTSLNNWQELLAQTFIDLDLSFHGGESSRETMERAVAVIQEEKTSSAETILLVTHGNLLTLLLKYFDNRFGYEEWSKLSNPDIYEVCIATDGQATISCLWKEVPECM